MAQSPRTCPNCGTVVLAGQRFCSNCGTQVETGGPAGQYAGPQPQRFPQAQLPPLYTPPYMPPPYAQQQYQQPQKTNPMAEVLGALGLLFFLRRYRPGYRPRRQSSGCCGCLVTLVILALVLGIPGYIAYRATGPGIINRLQNNASTGSSNGSILATQPPAALVTTQLNETVSYAGVDITILNAQQASSFSDDNNSSAPDGNTTLPTVVPASSSGATGVVPFQVPEGVTSYTLILLAKPNISPPITQATMDFRI